MKSSSRLAIVVMVCIALISATGCQYIADIGWKDPVTGKWEGDWYIQKMPKPGGKLKCDVERIARNEWKAIFEAEFGQTAAYKVELMGKREGDKVVFGGDVDLGAASGGVFTWTGEADGTKFNGKYSSKLYGGHFEMDRVVETK